MRQHCSGPFWDICRPIEDREFTNDQIGNFRTHRETIFWGKFSGRRLEILFPPLHKCRYCKVKVKVVEVIAALVYKGYYAKIDAQSKQ